MNTVESTEKTAGVVSAPAAPVEDNWLQGLSATQKRALTYLGQGISQVMVASTLGITESLISQFMADPRYAEEVTKTRLKYLSVQTGIDHKYMQAEEKLVDKLLKVIPLMSKPREILEGIRTINATKRRGVTDAPVGASGANIVQINLPGIYAAKFVTNIQNQIVEVQDGEGARSLITATPVSLNEFATAADREPETVDGTYWEASADPEHILREAAKRIEESGTAEIAPAGLRRGLAAKGKITADDL